MLTSYSLIRRSDCQTVRQPNFGEGSGDLESDWRQAIDVELRKRYVEQESFLDEVSMYADIT